MAKHKMLKKAKEFKSSASPINRCWLNIRKS